MGELQERLSGSWYRVLLDSSCDWEYWHNTLNQLEYVSDACRQITGYSPEDFLADPDLLVRIAHPDDKNLWQSHQQIRQSEQSCPDDIVYRIVRKDGQIRSIHDVCRPVYDTRRNYLGWWSSNRDITSRGQMKEPLMEYKRQMEAFFDLASVGIALGKPSTGQSTRVNQRMCDMVGYTATELLNIGFPGITHPEDRQSDWEGYSRARDSGAADYRNEKRYVRKDGRVIWVDVNVSFLRDQTGRAYSGVAIIRDITDRKLSEQKLKQSELRYRKLFDDNLAAVVLTKTDGTILDFNKAALQMLGYEDPQEFAQKSVWDLYVKRSDRQGCLALLKANKRLADFETRWFRKDGEVIDLLVAITLITDIVTSEDVIQGTFLDITERKRQEQSLQSQRDELDRLVRERTSSLNASRLELQDKAQQLARLASELTLAEQRERQRIAKVLHDELQQLIAAAQFRVDYIRYHVSDRDNVNDLNEIHALLNDSIKTSRTLTAELAPPAIHEGQLLDGLKWLSNWMKQKHGLEVELHVENTADMARKATKILLFEAIREILFNVVKHSGVKKATIEVEHQHNALEVLVADSGKGFDVEQMWNKSRKTGKGFGLVSIRDRLNIFGGQLLIESAPGQGSRFRLKVPVTPRKKKKPGMGTSAIIDIKAPPATKPPFAQTTGIIRVMLVDDHKMIRQGLSSLLSKESDIRIVAEASDGNQAIAKTGIFRPDVILMDYRMPGMSGLEATKIIHAEHPDIRIIALSMYDEAELEKPLKQAGASAFISKVAPAHELLQAIRQTKTPV